MLLKPRLEALKDSFVCNLFTDLLLDLFTANDLVVLSFELDEALLK